MHMRVIVWEVAVLLVISSVMAAVSVKETALNSNTLEIKAGDAVKAWVDANGLKVADKLFVDEICKEDGSGCTSVGEVMLNKLRVTYYG